MFFCLRAPSEYSCTVCCKTTVTNTIDNRNVKFFADLPDSSLTETAIGTHKTFLDTVGRTSVTIKAQNLVDDFRDRNLFITYDTTTASTLRKPLVVFLSTLAIYVATWTAGKVQVGFAKK